MEHLRKPEWLKVKKGKGQTGKVSRTLRSYALNSVCEQACCPNQGECFQCGTATFMLLGKNCTRNCTFCKVNKALPEPVNHEEPNNVAAAVKDMRLKHVVITSVTRDDLPDGGASHFARTIEAVRKLTPTVTIEVLIPDFLGDREALRLVLSAEPDILNHNVETVPNLYDWIRPKAVYQRSIELLDYVKKSEYKIFTKSGFMVGLGETKTQVQELLNHLHHIKCDIVTIGQYLQPSKVHYPVKEYIPPSQFEEYEQYGLELGIPCIASGPLVRSSYHAQKDLTKLKALCYSGTEQVYI